MDNAFICISAARPGLSPEDLTAVHRNLGVLLSTYGLPHYPAMGRYKGVDELSYLVPVTIDTVPTLTLVGLACKQESILLVVNGRASLIPMDGSPAVHLGTWTKVSQAEAQAQDAYTEVNGEWYVVR